MRNHYYLGEDELLHPQLPDHRFQLGPARVVIKRAHVELRRRRVQHTDAECAFVGLRVELADGHTVSCLLVSQELRVDQRPVRENFVELPEQ